MKTITQNPAEVIPDINESMIRDSIIVSICNNSNLYVAIKNLSTPPFKFGWKGADFHNTVIKIAMMPENSLIDLLIINYYTCHGDVIFYILENMQDIEYINQKYRLNEVNPRLLHMLTLKGILRDFS